MSTSYGPFPSTLTCVIGPERKASGVRYPTSVDAAVLTGAVRMRHSGAPRCQDDLLGRSGVT
jgi:hypothetical protein